MNQRLREEMDYCAPLGIPHSRFLSWDELDQDKALAWQREQRKVCPGCGTRAEQWERDPFALVASARRCRGCESIAQAREQVPEGEQGVQIVLITAEQAAIEAEALAEADQARQEATG